MLSLIATVDPSNSFFYKKVQHAPPSVKRCANKLITAYKILGESSFMVHPKGFGAVVVDPEGCQPNTLVTFYRGEVFPSWRWSEVRTRYL